jgi:magnesium transporter
MPKHSRSRKPSSHHSHTDAPRFHRQTLPGEAPGTVIPPADSPKPQMQVFAYSADAIVEKPLDDLRELDALRKQHPVVWLNVDGFGDAAILKQIADMFQLHPLAMEDVVHVHQRSKVDEYNDVLFVVVRMVSLQDHELETEQLSLFLGKNYVVTFQDRPDGDSLDPVRNRLRLNQGRIRRSGPDHLLYALIDAVIDGYFPVVEKLGDLMDDLDAQIADLSKKGTMQAIHDVRVNLLQLRRAAWPHREALQNLQRDTHPQISDETRIYLRDCYDHVIQIIDVLETYREMCADLRDLYLTSVGNRTNEIMRVLTIMSTIFIPLSFIASVYGMNFNTERSPWNMPELNWIYGYPFALALMASTAAALLVYFWRKGWFQSRK